MRERILLRIQCQNNITVDGEPGAISSSEDLQDVVRESFSWSFAVLAPPPTTAWMSRTMPTHLRRAGRFITTYPVAAASGFNEVTELVICRRSLSARFLAASASL
jgi:hypothetical protein